MTVGTDEPVIIGLVYRWHREWAALSSEGEYSLGRPPKGQKGADIAAARLAAEYAAGTITALPKTVTAETEPVTGPVPLLDPRMPQTPDNEAHARIAFAGLAAHHWTARGGYPGSDNVWPLVCDLCGWTGAKHWSHLRGRNGEPPRISRHTGGCIGEDKIRELIPAYRK